MNLTGKQAKQILDTYWAIENDLAKQEQVIEAYKQIPNHLDLAHLRVMIAGIKSYVIFNLEDLEYTVLNSDIGIDEDVMDELLTKTTMEMTTQLINEQSGNPEDEKDVPIFTDVPKPKRVYKKRGRKPGRKAKKK